MQRTILVGMTDAPERPDFIPLLAALVPVGVVMAFGLAAVWWHGVNS